MKKVLIVDDSLMIRRNLKRIIKKSGYDIVGEECDGEKGVKAYKELKPDIVTMDINMPNMNGIEAIKEIIDYDMDAKIVVVSSVSQNSIVADCLFAGAKNYITKPIEEQNVLGAIKKVFEEV